MLCKCWCSMWTKKKKRRRNSDNTWRHHGPTSSTRLWRWLGDAGLAQRRRSSHSLRPADPALSQSIQQQLHSKKCRDPDESHVQPHPAQQNSTPRQRGKGLQESTPHFGRSASGILLFFFFFFRRGGFFVLRTRGSNFCGDKRGKFCASCVTLASVLENNLRVPLCSSCVPLLLQLLWKKFTIVDSLVVSSAPQLIHSSSLPAEQKGVGI